MKARWLRPDQVAEILNISKRSVYRLVDRGHFACAKFGGSLRIEAGSLDRYVAHQVGDFEYLHGQCERVENCVSIESDAPAVRYKRKAHG